MSAIMGKILFDPVNGKAISDIDGQSDRVDVASEVPLRKVNVSAVPLLKSWSRFPNVQTFNLVSKSVPEVYAEGNARLQIFLVFFLVWSD